MAAQIFPTKGNLINTKKSLALAKMGYDLMDRKRNILVREMMSMMETAKTIRDDVEKVYAEAFTALQKANITLGICEDVANAVPIEEGVHITYRSVMGVEIPNVSIDKIAPDNTYGFIDTNSQLDAAYISFDKAKHLTVVLAEIENSIYRLANAIKTTQKRANALKNIIIPNFEQAIKFISDALEEKEREEFSRLKAIKAFKVKSNAGEGYP